MLRTLILLATLGVAVAPAGAQSALTLFFSSDGTEVSASGAGGSALAPGNAAAVFRDEALVTVNPGTGSPYFAHAIASVGTWGAYLGDEDADLNYTESPVGNLNALHVPAGAPNPPSSFDVYVSFSQNIGPAGAVALPILDGDVVRFLPGGGVHWFITEAQIVAAMNTTVTNVDVNGFTISPSNGDLYWTLTASADVNGTAIADGGVIRLRGINYVANADGTVASVTAGAAEIVLTESDVDGFYLSATGAPVNELDGLALDPAGGSFTSQGTGKTMPNFWMSADNAAVGPAIVTTSGGGAYASQGGITFNSGPALGLGSVAFDGGPVSTVTALAWESGSPTTTPRFLNIHDLSIPAPGVMKLDVGGATPSGSFLLVGKIPDVNTIGGFTSRLPVLPFFPSIAGPGGFLELFIDDANDPIFQFLAFDPPILLDPQGYGSRSWNLPTAPAGLGFAFQGIDLGNLALSTPVIPVTAVPGP